MSIVISPRKLYKLTNAVHLSDTPPRPLIADISSEFDPNTVFLVKSAFDDTFAFAFALPPSITDGGNVTPEAMFWVPLSIHTGATIASGKDNDFIAVVERAGFENKLYLVWETVGANYKPDEEATFLSSAVGGRLYIHVYRNSGTTYYATITDHLGKKWVNTTKAFTLGGEYIGGLVHSSEVYTPIANTYLPGAIPADGTDWYPDVFQNMAQWDSYSFSLSMIHVATPSVINSQVVDVTTTAVPKPINSNLIYHVVSNNELVMVLPTIPVKEYPPLFKTEFMAVGVDGKLFYPELSGTSSVLSNGQQTSLCVKIVPTSIEDYNYIASLATYTGQINVIISASGLNVAGLMVPGIPNMVVDAVLNDDIGLIGGLAPNTYHVSNNIYLFEAGETQVPLISTTAMVLPATYGSQTHYAPLATTPRIWNSYLRGGKTVLPIVNGNNLDMYLSGVKGWSTLFHHITLGTNTTAVTDYRISFKPSSPLTQVVLDSATPPCKLLVGISSSDTKHASLTITPDNIVTFNNRDPHPYFFMEVNPLASDLTVIKHIPSSAPALYTPVTEVVPNTTGLVLNWTGGSLLELGIHQVSATVATLTVYLNGAVIGTVIVPWITTGTILLLGSSTTTFTNTGATFSLLDYTTTLNTSTSAYTPPVSGGGSDPDPVINSGYIEVTSYPVATIPSSDTVNPYSVYIKPGSGSSQVYIPALVGVDRYRPTQFAMFTIPYTSGPIYDAIAKNQWISGHQAHSYVSDGLGLSGIPTPTYPGLLYSSEEITTNTYQVTVRTDANWSTVIGVFSATLVPNLRTYITNPYPSSAVTSFGPLTESTRPRKSTAIIVDDNTLVLHSGSTTEKDSAISIPFSVANGGESKWTLSFNRVSSGNYSVGDNGFFRIAIRPIRHDHVYVVNPTAPTSPLQVVPFPHVTEIGINFRNMGNDPIVVRESSPQGYTYSTPSSIANMQHFKPFDGSERIHVEVSAVGLHTQISIYGDSKLVAKAIVSEPWMASGSIVLYHGNQSLSSETLSNILFRQGGALDDIPDTTPLVLAPTIHTATTTVINGGTSGQVYSPRVDTSIAYVDLYIHNSTDTLGSVIIHIEPAIGATYPLATQTPIPAGTTLVLRSRFVSVNDKIKVTSTGNVSVRAAAIEQLK